MLKVIQARLGNRVQRGGTGEKGEPGAKGEPIDNPIDLVCVIFEKGTLIKTTVIF